MQHVDVYEVPPRGGLGAADARRLTEPLGATNVAINRFAVEPGESIGGGMHTHMQQEELFYVVEGTATFETKPEPTAESEVVTVSAGEAVRFAPGEYQEGRNESDERLVVLGIGGPQESGESRAPRPCTACGESDYLVAEPVDGEMELTCPECGATYDL